MNREKLYSILSELRKDDGIVTESVELNGYSEFIKSKSQELEEFVEDVGFEFIDEIDVQLGSLRNKCEKDNDLAKKTVLSVRPDLMKDLISAVENCGNKVVSFIEKEYKTGSDLNDATEDMEKLFKKVNKLTSEVFSYKDEFNTHYLVSEYFSLLKPLDNIKDHFDNLDDCLDKARDDEKTLKEFSDFRRDNRIGDDPELNKKKDECGIIHNKHKKFIGILNEYISTIKTVYKKIFDTVSKLK